MKRFVLLLSILAVFVVGSCATGPQRSVAPPEKVSITADVVYGHKEGMALFYDVFRPVNADGAAVLYMVSGGWFSRWLPPQTRIAGFTPLLDKGITVIAVHHGSAPRFKVPEAVADVRRAVRHVRLNAAALRINPDRLGVFGGSAGGHLALMLGLASDAGNPSASDPVERVSNSVKAVVAFYPPVDLRRWSVFKDRFPALDFNQNLAADVSPLLFVDKGDPPTLIVHGSADKLVPVRLGQSIYEALKAAGVPTNFIMIDGGEHGFPKAEHRAQAMKAAADWFAEKL
ncbi:MAG: alpha/beta hydrolase [Deltaproteobacteria bacterium]|nr:alpha/beta hydrolase [Deltaproteobacteria bacterium]